MAYANTCRSTGYAWLMSSKMAYTVFSNPKSETFAGLLKTLQNCVKLNEWETGPKMEGVVLKRGRGFRPSGGTPTLNMVKCPRAFLQVTMVTSCF